MHPRKALWLPWTTVLLILLLVVAMFATVHADGTGQATDEPPAAYGGQIVVIDHAVLKLGGFTPVGSNLYLVSCVWVYDIHGQWVRLNVSPSWPGAVFQATAPFGNKVYLFYGQGGSAGTSLSPDVYSFDPEQNRFDKVGRDLMAPAPDPVIYGSAASGTDAIYFTGGANLTGTPSNQAWQFYPDAAPSYRWERLPNMPLPLAGHGSAVVNSDLYVFGGYSQQASDKIFRFKHDVDSWEPIGTLPTPLVHAATAQMGDRVWLLGGKGKYEQDVDTVVQCRMPDPACTPDQPCGQMVCSDTMQIPGGPRSYTQAAAFVPSNPMTQGVDVSALDLPDVRILVFGGKRGSTILGDTQLFSPWRKIYQPAVLRNWQ